MFAFQKLWKFNPKVPEQEEESKERLPLELWYGSQNKITTRLVEDARHEVSIPNRKEWEKGFVIIRFTDGPKTKDGVGASSGESLQTPHG